MGFSKWYYPYVLTAEEKAAGVGEDRLPESWMEGSEEELCKKFWGTLYQARRDNMDHEKDYCAFFHFYYSVPAHVSSNALLSGEIFVLSAYCTCYNHRPFCCPVAT